MSDAIPHELAAALAISDRKANVEQQIFIFSPLGTLATAAIIFLLWLGSYVAIALAAHVPLESPASRGGSIAAEARAAFVLSLLIATALGLQRYARIKDRSEINAYMPLLRNGIMSFEQFAMLAPLDARIKRATLIGLLVGLAASLFVIPNTPLIAHHRDSATFFWFAAATTVLITLFFRGAEMTRAGGAGTRRFIDDELVIDLLRIDHLSVIGRSAGRLALIWFSVSAVTCLFLVGSPISATFILVLLAGCLGMGLWIFMRTMDHVHQRIRAAKGVELERVRSEIDTARGGTSGDIALALPGLLAYEARIAAVHEWPFDQTTLVRVGASALILTVPWFGQALAGSVVERIGQWMH